MNSDHSIATNAESSDRGKLHTIQKTTQTIQRPKLDLAVALVVFLIALIIRLAYISQLHTSPLFDEPVMDELYHDQWAQAISEGNRFVDGPYFRAPLYPAMLGFIYKVFGHDYIAPRLIQAVLGSLSCVIVYFIGRSIFNRLIGALAAIGTTTYWILIYYDGELLIATLIVFFDIMLIWLLILGLQSRRKLCFFASGLLLGLSAIARPNILFFAPAIAIWIVFVFRDNWRFALMNAFLVAFGASLVIAPITLRNYLIGHDFVLIASQGGVNFYIGNNPQSDGRTAIVPGTPGGWWEGYYASIERAEKAAGRKLKPSEVSHYYYQEGLKFVREQPCQWLQLTWLKFRLWWSRWEFPNDKGIYFITEQFTPIVQWLPLGFGAIAPLGILGMVLCLRNRLSTFPLWGFILTYSLSFLPFFCTSRYRVPIIPPLMILSVYSLWEVLRSLYQLHWKRLIGMAVVLTLASGLVFLTPQTAPVRNDAFDLVRLGNAYMRQGRLATAEDAYQRAVLAAPYYLTARSNLGALLLRMNRIDESIHHLSAGVGSSIRLSGEVGDLAPRTRFLLAQALEWRGATEPASQQFEHAARLKPEYKAAIAPTREKIAAMKSCLDSALKLFGTQKYGEAAQELRNCKDIDENNYRVLDLLVHALIRAGKFEQAVEILRQELPNNQEWAAANLATILSIAPVDSVRNPAEALKYGQIACPDVDQCAPFFLDSLAVAVAENGRLNEGIRLTKLALQRAKESAHPNDRALADMINARLAVYAAGRSFRMPLSAQPQPPPQAP